MLIYLKKMKRLLIPLLAALALPTAIEAEPKYEEKIFDEKKYNFL